MLVNDNLQRTRAENMMMMMMMMMMMTQLAYELIDRLMLVNNKNR